MKHEPYDQRLVNNDSQPGSWVRFKPDDSTYEAGYEPAIDILRRANVAMESVWNMCIQGIKLNVPVQQVCLYCRLPKQSPNHWIPWGALYRTNQTGETVKLTNIIRECPVPNMFVKKDQTTNQRVSDVYGCCTSYCDFSSDSGSRVPVPPQVPLSSVAPAHLRERPETTVTGSMQLGESWEIPQIFEEYWNQEYLKPFKSLFWSWT